MSLPQSRNAPDSPKPERRPHGSTEPLPSHYDDLSDLSAHIWALFARGVADRRSAFHTPALTTIGADGFPATRTVVLRGADRGALELLCHTDARSAKVGEIAADPRIAVHVYDPGAKTQVRFQGHGHIHRFDALAERQWGRTRDFSRACYRQRQGSGLGIEAGGAFEQDLTDDLAYGNFAVIRLVIARGEWLYLAAQGHRRAALDFATDPATARWLAP